MFIKKTNREKIVLPTKCRNCGVELQGRYCHLCGQDMYAGAQRSVRSVVFNMFENIFSLDNKVFVTLVNLIFRPGKLTLEYFEGHVVRYVVPGKLFWFVSILFFALLVSRISFDEPVSLSSVSTSISVDDNENIEVLKTNEVKKANFSTYAPYITFVMIPFFALALMLFFHKKGKDILYVDHLIFSIHFHTFVFLCWTILMSLTWIWSFSAYWDIIWDILILFVIPILYLIISLHVVYRPSKMSLLWKFPLMILFYFIGLVAVLVLIFVLLDCFIE